MKITTIKKLSTKTKTIKDQTNSLILDLPNQTTNLTATKLFQTIAQNFDQTLAIRSNVWSNVHLD